MTTPSRWDVLRAAKTRDVELGYHDINLQSEAVKDCAESVKADNPDMDESTAFAICQDMENRGELADGQPCPDGEAWVNGECVPREEVETPPSVTSKMSDARVFQLSELENDPIEREELGDGRVAYRNMAILTAGVWKDSGSRETIWYSPRGLENLQVTDDNVVNIMHDEGNEVSAAGEIDPDSLHAENGTLYADIILDTSNAAGQYADENLQQTLETDGQQGFGGPSVEIAAEGQQVEYNAKKGMLELVKGVIDGLGLVKNPASKPVSFARQTATRSVALSSGGETKGLYLQRGDMDATVSNEKLLEAFGLSDEIELEEEVAVDDLAALMADALDISMDDMTDALEPLVNQEDEEGDDDGNGEEEAPDDDGGEDEGDEMPGEAMEVMQEQIDDLWNAIKEMKAEMMASEDVEGELSELRDDVADADTAQELSEAVEALDKRLSDLEDEPKKPRSMADGDGDEEIEGTVTPAGQWDSIRSSYTR